MFNWYKAHCKSLWEGFFEVQSIGLNRHGGPYEYKIDVSETAPALMPSSWYGYLRHCRLLQGCSILWFWCAVVQCCCWYVHLPCLSQEENETQKKLGGYNVLVGMDTSECPQCKSHQSHLLSKHSRERKKYASIWGRQR